MDKFEEKQFGRIYTDTTENIKKIKDIIKQMDQFEYEYLPKDLITVYKGYFSCEYVGKFDDLNLDELINNCKKKNIPCGYIKGYEEDCFNTCCLDKNSVDKCVKLFYESGMWSKEDVLKYYEIDYIKE